MRIFKTGIKVIKNGSVFRASDQMPTRAKTTLISYGETAVRMSIITLTL